MLKPDKYIRTHYNSLFPFVYVGIFHNKKKKKSAGKGIKPFITLTLPQVPKEISKGKRESRLQRCIIEKNSTVPNK